MAEERLARVEKFSKAMVLRSSPMMFSMGSFVVLDWCNKVSSGKEIITSKRSWSNIE